MRAAYAPLLSTDEQCKVSLPTQGTYNEAGADARDRLHWSSARSLPCRGDRNEASTGEESGRLQPCGMTVPTDGGGIVNVASSGACGQLHSRQRRSLTMRPAPMRAANYM